MEYTQIISLVPQGEHFDSAAINEGVYLTVAHINAIEASLAANAQTVSSLNDKIKLANEAKKKADDNLIAANTTIESQKTTLKEKETEITTLNTKVEELENDGSVTQTTKASDKNPKTKPKAHEDPNNSINSFADRFLGAPVAKKKAEVVEDDD